MANQYGLFWNSQNSDRLYDADSFSEWLYKFFTTGVFNGDLQVTATSGMVVSVGTGYANLEGKVRFFDTSTTVTLSPASGTYPRIDTIVVRRDDTNRQITIEYVTGQYSGDTPSATAPTRAGGIYEIVLAEIYVDVGATSITSANITDTRSDTTVCGWVTGSVDSVDVDQLTTQATAQFTAWFNSMKNQLSQDAAGNLQLEIDAINNTLGSDALDTTSQTVTGAINELNTDIGNVSSVLDWTFLGTHSGTATAMDLPASWKELYIIVGESSATSWCAVTYALYDALAQLNVSQLSINVPINVPSTSRGVGLWYSASKIMIQSNSYPSGETYYISVWYR